MTFTYDIQNECRSCGHKDLDEVLFLGHQPLANALLKKMPESPLLEPRASLTLLFCPRCSLVQIQETVDPSQLFSDYPYFSSVSPAIVNNARDAVQDAVAFHGHDRTNIGRVIEVASNDGYLLQHYQRMGIEVLGIDPAANVAAKAREAGVPTICDFFGEKLAGEVGRCDVLHANNVLAHVADTNGFVRGIAKALRVSGVAIIEVPYLGSMIADREFDTVYHEHLCYFSLTALQYLFLRHGLFVKDVKHIPIHGGSLRLFVQHNDQMNGYATSRVADMLANERTVGMLQFPYYESFQQRVDSLCRTLTSSVARLSRDGQYAVWGYGASAKGSTLLNYPRAQGLAEMLTFVVDKSPHKQGLLTPGTHIPIVAPEAVYKFPNRPDFLLLLTWNFKGEISRENAPFLADGGRIICPIPRVELIDSPLRQTVV